MRRRMWMMAGGALCGIALCGWISNAIGKATCEARAAQWLYEALGRPDVLYFNGDFRAGDAFAGNLIRYVPTKGKMAEPGMYPYVKVYSSCIIPFYVRVYYEWERGALIGGAGEVRHVCLFGKSWDLGQVEEWAF